MDEDLDTRQALLYRVKGYVNNKVVQESDIIIFLSYIDSDGDGLSDEEEARYGTDKTKSDTDTDGLSDYLEVHTYKTNPLKQDSDGDGLDDGLEIRIGLNPLKQDSDANGILDNKEDSDKDGLTNEQEIQFKTALDRMDSDGDGLDDKKEMQVGSNPNKQDSDEDGLTDKEELDLGTNPLHPDSNGNGIKDGDEKFSVMQEADTKTKNSPTLDITLSGEQMKTLHIEEVAEEDIFLNKDIPGFMGAAYNFEMDGKFQSAEVSFPFDAKRNAGATPRIYYFNEELQLLEELPNQRVENGSVIVQLEHFSKYILLDKIEFDNVWNTEIRPPSSAGDKTKMDMSFVLDSSGSMEWNDPENIRVATSKQFVDKFQTDDRGMVVSFYDGADLISPLTSDKAKLKASLDSLADKYQSGTSVYKGIEKSLQEYKKNSTSATKFMFVLTDGEDTGTYDYDKIIKELKKENITVYTMGLGKSIDTNLLEKIAKQTGGKYYHASTSGELVDEIDKVIGDTVDFVTDTDKDGISDYYEKAINDGTLRLGTGKSIAGKLNPNKADSDGDRLLDGQEIEIAEIRGSVYVKYDSDPTLKDSDGDGYDDYAEFLNATNPIEWTVSHRDLAMSAEIAYADLKVGAKVSTLSSLDKNFNEHGSVTELKGWEIIKYEENKETGFAAMAMKNGNDIITAYRGSDEALDHIEVNPPTYLYTYNQQYPDAQGFMSDVMIKYPKANLYVTGHSLGGNLAYIGGSLGLNIDQVIGTNRLKELVVFNGFGVPGKLLGSISGMPDLYERDREILENNDNKIINY